MQYTLLFDWMFELGKEPLTLTEAVTYAVIYSFSRDNRGSFIASYKYLSKLTRLSERQQIRVLGKLIKDNLIIKKETAPGYPNEYTCNLNKIPEHVNFKNVELNSCDKLTHQVTNNKNNINNNGYDKFAHPMTLTSTKHDITDDKKSEYINNINKNNINNKQLDKSSFSNHMKREAMDEEAEKATSLNLFWLKK